MIAEMQNSNNLEILDRLFLEKKQIVKEIVIVVLDNKEVLESGECAEYIDVTPKSIKDAEHYLRLLENMEKSIEHTTRDFVRERLQENLCDLIKNMVMIFTSWYACIKNQESYESSKVIATPSPSNSAHIARLDPPAQRILGLEEEQKKQLEPQFLQQVTRKKETITLELQQDLPTIVAPQEMRVPEPQENLNSAVQTTKTPILARDLSIANKGQIIVHNNIYKVNLGHLSELENNLLFSLFNRLKDKQDTIVVFDKREVKLLAGNPKMPADRLLSVTKKLVDNLIKANFKSIIKMDSGLVIERSATLFSIFEIGIHDGMFQFLKVQVNAPHFTYLLNSISANFTAMQLNTYVSLSGKYTKNLFRLFERFKHAKNSKGYFEVVEYRDDLEGFRNFMGIPKTFTIGDIDNYALYPAFKQLAGDTHPYKAIKYKKVKRPGLRGQKVTGVVFTITPNPTLEKQQKKQEQQESQNLYRDEATKEKEISILKDMWQKTVDLHTAEHTFKNLRFACYQHSNDTGYIIGLFFIKDREHGAFQLERKWADKCPDLLKNFKGFVDDNQLENYFTYDFKDIDQFNNMVKFTPLHTEAQKREIQSCHGRLGEFFENNKPQYTFRKVKLVDTRFSKIDMRVIALFEIVDGTDKDFYMAEEHKAHIETFGVDGQEYFTHIFTNPKNLINKFVKTAYTTTA
ncbi:replication initiation protein [Helicobacter sp. NHP22-001]|uniref:replication initiation protein n=1 Tax=Helicobacter sp. NHP22-001 TaxID=3040202 RepID=UPI0025559EB3|nr:replication initiation protein [Helicobacter sp. NHP22-001]